MGARVRPGDVEGLGLVHVGDAGPDLQGAAVAVGLLGSIVKVWTPLSETSCVSARVERSARSGKPRVLVSEICWTRANRAGRRS